MKILAVLKICPMPAGSVCVKFRNSEGEEEAQGHAECFGFSLRVAVNVCTHSLFGSV